MLKPRLEIKNIKLKIEDSIAKAFSTIFDRIDLTKSNSTLTCEQIINSPYLKGSSLI